MKKKFGEIILITASIFGAVTLTLDSKIVTVVTPVWLLIGVVLLHSRSDHSESGPVKISFYRWLTMWVALFYSILQLFTGALGGSYYPAFHWDFIIFLMLTMVLCRDLKPMPMNTDSDVAIVKSNVSLTIYKTFTIVLGLISGSFALVLLGAHGIVEAFAGHPVSWVSEYPTSFGLFIFMVVVCVCSIYLLVKRK